MVKHHIILFCLVIGLSCVNAHAQDGEITNRSTSTQHIDGREYYLHAVLRGQTLYSIARAYGVPVEAIIHENPDLSDGLRYDQIIRIPVIEEKQEVPREVKSHAPRPEGEYVEHTVNPQETLFGLSRKYDVSIETILYYNPYARGGLKIGQLLRIPVTHYDKDPPSAPKTPAMISKTAEEQRKLSDNEVNEIYASGFFPYTVVAGDTKFSVSRRAGITIEQLEKINPEISRDGLRAGQEIKLPVITDKAGISVAAEDEPMIKITLNGRDTVNRVFKTDCFEPALKKEYHVALLIPLYLEELMNNSDRMPAQGVLNNQFYYQTEERGRGFSLEELEKAWPNGLSTNHKAFTFISFYQGVLLALDSIRAEGVNIQLHVHDVCQDYQKAKLLTELPEFMGMDLIIGPFHRQSLNHIAAYGRQHDIPVVSPLLPDNHQLKGFPNLYKTSPSLESMLHGLAGYVSKNYPQENIIIVHNQQDGAADIIKSFRETLLEEVALMNNYYERMHLARINGYYFDQTLVGSRQTNVLVMPDTVTSMVSVSSKEDRMISLPKPYNLKEVIYRKVGMDGLQEQMRRDRENVIITLISGEPFLSDYLRQLHALRHEYNISVFGIPDWQDYASIEIDYLQNLKVHVFVPVFINYYDQHIRNFIYRFREVYQTEPDVEAIKAAQTAFFFFEALALYGKGFGNCIPFLNNRGFESPYVFDRPMGEANGWENQHFYIYRIQDYRHVDVQRPIELRLTDKRQYYSD